MLIPCVWNGTCALCAVYCACMRICVSVFSISKNFSVMFRIPHSFSTLCFACYCESALALVSLRPMLFETWVCKRNDNFLFENLCEMVENINVSVRAFGWLSLFTLAAHVLLDWYGFTVHSVSWFIQSFGMLTFHFLSIWNAPSPRLRFPLFRCLFHTFFFLDTSINLSKPIALSLCVPQDFKDNEIYQRRREKNNNPTHIHTDARAHTTNRTEQSKLNLWYVHTGVCVCQ